MIVLRSEELLVRVDPGHGAEVLDLVDLRTGRQLLGRPPFGSAPAAGGDLDEPTWTAGYRGGWQLVAPNAGNECVVDGVHHGFHGRASVDPWHVLGADAGSAAMSWRGHDLEIVRRLSVDGDTLAVATEITATADGVPLVAVEHLAVGLELLEPEVGIEIAGGTAYELSEATGPPSTPPNGCRWPEVRLLDGSTERADRWPLERSRSRYLVVADIEAGRVVIRNMVRGQALELIWDTDWLRHLWIWHEVREYGGRWRGLAEILAVEPASVPHGLGLQQAIGQGQARFLQRGECLRYRVAVRACG